MISKIVIVDRSNASSPMAVFNERSTHTPPGFGVNLIGGPPGTDVLIQAPSSNQAVLIEGPPGTGASVQAPPGYASTLKGGPHGK